MQLLENTSRKFPDSKILFSSLIPRKDHLHEKTVEVNDVTKKYISKLKNVEQIEHRNLHEAHLHDKKHLNRDGVAIFARNITRAIYKGNLSNSHALNFPQERQRQVKRFPPQTSTTNTRRFGTSYRDVVKRGAVNPISDQRVNASHASQAQFPQPQFTQPQFNQPQFNQSQFLATGTSGVSSVPIALTLTPEQLHIIKNSFSNR